LKNRKPKTANAIAERIANRTHANWAGGFSWLRFFSGRFKTSSRHWVHVQFEVDDDAQIPGSRSGPSKRSFGAPEGSAANWQRLTGGDDRQIDFSDPWRHGAHLQ